MYTVKIKTSKVNFMAFKSEKKLEKIEFFKTRFDKKEIKKLQENTYHTTS